MRPLSIWFAASGASSTPLSIRASSRSADLLQLNNQADHYFGPIIAAIEPVIPSDEVYELRLPLMAMQGKKGREVRQIQKALIAWIKETAPALSKRSYADYLRPAPPANIPNVPFPVELQRFGGMPNFRRLQIIHVVTGDRGPLREQRMRQACDDKFGKLASWKKDAGARTILLLENPDILLTHSSNVADMFLSIAEGRADWPDETYLIDTYTSGDWYLWPLLIDGKSYFDLGKERHPLAWEVNPASLAFATGR